MKTDDRNKTLDKKEIGQIKLVMDWLDKYVLPYKKREINRIVDDKGYTKAFEILLDKDGFIENYKDETFIPDFVKKGSIKVTITF